MLWWCSLLADQLRALQSANRRVIPRLQSTDDLEKLTAALRRTKQRELVGEDRGVDNPLQCTASTHRCHHAVHAYSGVPCAAYSQYPTPHTALPTKNIHTKYNIFLKSEKFLYYCFSLWSKFLKMIRTLRKLDHD